MAVYKVFGTYLKSSEVLPGLTSDPGKMPNHVFQKYPPAHQSTTQLPELEWFHTWTDGAGEVWAQLAKQNDQYLIRFLEYADFWVSADGCEIECVPCPDIPPETINHLFLDQVFPCLLSRGNQMMLHAAAVGINGGAVAFIGETGAGKSTLTSSLCRAGFQLLTDDGLLVVEEAGRFWAVPGYPSVRLWPASLPEIFSEEIRSTDVAHYSDKQRVGAEQAAFSFAMERMPLRRIYLLRPREEEDERGIAIMPISPREAFNECFNSVFRLDFRDRALLTEQFTMTARLVERTPVFALSFPHDFSQLSAVRASLLTHLDQN
ncbi:MAG: hypothetical protein ACKVZH_20740 [Blastocatellia bacterium]